MLPRLLEASPLRSFIEERTDQRSTRHSQRLEAKLSDYFATQASVDTKASQAFEIGLDYHTKGDGPHAQVWLQLAKSFTANQELKDLIDRIVSSEGELALSTSDYNESLFSSHDELNEVISLYPTTELSRRAFRFYEEKKCLEPNIRLQEKTLLAISRNTSLDEGIKEWLVGEIEQSYSAEPTVLIKLAFNLRLYDYVSAKLEPLLSGNEPLSARTRRDMELLYLRSLYRSGNIDGSLQLVQKLIAKTSNPFVKKRLRSILAHALRSAGEYDLSAEMFQMIGRSSRSNRWASFFEFYRQQKWMSALGLIKTIGYAREKEFPESLNYWRAKTFEKLNMQENSLLEFRKVLTTGSARFYSYVSHAKITKEQGGRDGVRFASQDSKSMFLPKRRDSQKSFAFDGIEHLLRQVFLGPRVFSDVGRRHDKSLAAGVFGSDLALAKKLHDGAQHNLGWRLAHSNAVEKFGPRSSHFDMMNSLEENQLLWQSVYPKAYAETTQAAAKRYGIDEYLVWSIMKAESRFDPNAESWVGARGLMQIMPYTGLKIADHFDDGQFHVDQLYSPVVNISYASAYISMLSKYYSGYAPYVIAAYNAGPKAVNQWIERCRGCELDEFTETITYKETRTYLRRVLANFQNYYLVYRGEYKDLQTPRKPLNFDEFQNIF